MLYKEDMVVEKIGRGLALRLSAFPNISPKINTRGILIRYPKSKALD